MLLLWRHQKLWRHNVNKKVVPIVWEYLLRAIVSLGNLPVVTNYRILWHGGIFLEAVLKAITYFQTGFKLFLDTHPLYLPFRQHFCECLKKYSSIQKSPNTEYFLYKWGSTNDGRKLNFSWMNQRFALQRFLMSNRNFSFSFIILILTHVRSK